MNIEWTYFELVCDVHSCTDKIKVIEANLDQGCSSSPCLNNGECANVYNNGKISGYYCSCPCGFCGTNCEQINYDLTRNACIWGNHVSNLPDEYFRPFVTLKQCLTFCAKNHPICKGVDYSEKGSCYLNRKSSKEVRVSPRCNRYLRQTWNLYELNCNCQNEPVIYSQKETM
ncbi:hypothetical protein B4U79_18491 [Dinothrombium tinctorium]|nr:hypothetical protein B4U79_18493 [Dinothrombium tinctorium]RWS02382.1 hypothetical protein B4U79_18491 [Dinothrombium tinctorium]